MEMLSSKTEILKHCPDLKATEARKVHDMQKIKVIMSKTFNILKWYTIVVNAKYSIHERIQTGKTNYIAKKNLFQLKSSQRKKIMKWKRNINFGNRKENASHVRRSITK